MPFVPLKKFHNYFISSAGYVFRIVNGAEEILPARKIRRSGRMEVLIDRKPKDLLYLMMEHFDIQYTPYDKIKFTITTDQRIPLSSISVKPFLNKYGIDENEERLLYKYSCDIKANSANSRCEEKITPLQVFFSLKIHEFKCVYCGLELVNFKWHLDHFASLHKGGKNVFENIVPACEECNIMKGAMEGKQFHKHCIKVAENFMYAGKDDVKSYEYNKAEKSCS